MEHITEGMAGEQESLIISEEQAGQRADVGLAALLDITRSNMQKLLDDGRAVKGSKVLKANYKLRAGDEIVVTLPEPQPLDAQPENIPLDIIYEDDDVIVVNKARGMVVHPAAGNYSGTLVNALLYHCKNLSGINGVIRPGIVHRLDKDTSGIMICAKNDEAHLSLSQQIQAKTARRTYLAVVRGNIKTDSGTIETLIARDKNDRKKMAVVKENPPPPPPPPPPPLIMRWWSALANIRWCAASCAPVARTKSACIWSIWAIPWWATPSIRP